MQWVRIMLGRLFHHKAVCDRELDEAKRREVRTAVHDARNVAQQSVMLADRSKRVADNSSRVAAAAIARIEASRRRDQDDANKA